jgi:DNA-binding NarL/FixJ family response regulator
MEIRRRARVLIADDHTLVADACKSLLEPEFEVVGIVADWHAAVQAAAQLRPNVIVLDISMPRLNGLDAGEEIRQKNRAIKLVYLP